MEAVKQNRTFKAEEKTGGKSKTCRKYKDDIRTAYDIGYTRGWDDAYDIPKRVGSKTAAAYGYKKGLRNRKRADKYTNQYNHGGKR